MSQILEKLFKLKEANTDIKTEIIAGITTFLTMSYIIIVNPSILSTPGTGMNFNGVLFATVLVCTICTLLMGLYANLPYGVAPGMGINAFFTYTIILTMKVPWETALGIVFVAGVLFIVLTISGIRDMIVKSIPMSLRLAIAGGIGLFISFIGFKNSGMITGNSATIVGLGNLHDPKVILFLVGLLITSYLVIKNVKGALLIGIVLTTVIAMPFGLAKLPPQIMSLPDVSSVFLKMDVLSVFSIAMIPPIFTLLFTDLFDSISTFIGISQAAPVLLDKDNEPKNMRQALMVDAIATMFAGMVGSSSGTAYVESAAGVREGGRTGLVAVVVGLLFLPFMFFSPLLAAIPSFATAPALVLVGVFMIGGVQKINFEDFEEGVPAFLAMILIPLTYSITQGITWGFASYTIIKVLNGKAREVHPMMYIISVCLLLIIFGVKA